MNGKSGTATTTAKGLPEWVITEGHPIALLERSHELYSENKNGKVYGGQTYADQTQEEIDGITNMANRGRNGDTTISKGTTEVNSVLDGDYLPGTTQNFIDMLDVLTQSATNKHGSDINANIGAKLYHVGDPSGDNLSDDLEDTSVFNNHLVARLYYHNYSNERSIQDSAISMSIEFGRQPIVDADALRMAGLYQREYNQGELEDIYKLWYDSEVSKVRYLEVLGNAIRGLVGTETATTRPYYRTSPMVGMMGGAMSGVAMGTAVMPGVGTAVGAFAGAIMGFASS